MALAKVLSSALLGVDAYRVKVEVDLATGVPVFTTVGLPDAAVRESRDRVKPAMANCGFPFPLQRITVNLAPAHLRKAGRAFDLPITLGLLWAGTSSPTVVTTPGAGIRRPVRLGRSVSQFTR